MIVDSGKIYLLNSQLTYIGGLYWALFTNNFAISNATVITDLAEASWAGYARVVYGMSSFPLIVGPRAVTTPTIPPSFGNSSGLDQSFYGWMLLDTGTNQLIAAVNTGIQTIPDGLTYGLSPAISDTQE